ncbi:MAG: hypothetical protein GY857_09660 [Desulfobacula sp.]|nr:hypothetical protein [Desulfobacula sp.]
MENRNERLELLNKFIQTKKAVTIAELSPHVPHCIKTIRRDIKELNGISSYTHRGKYITLQNIPAFDRNGIWFYRNIGFTKYRNSLDLILNLINNSDKSYTKAELEDIMKIQISKQIQILLKQNKLHRVKLGAKYCYLSEELARNKKRRRQLLDIDVEEYYDKKIRLSDLISVIKAILAEYKIDMADLGKLIKKYSLDVPVKNVEQILLTYDLSSKKSLSSLERVEIKVSK